jgi:hypothetical protein
MECDPLVEGEDPVRTLIRIEKGKDRFRIIEGGTVLSEQLMTRDVVDFLYAHIFSRTLAEAPGAPLLHAACLRRNGCRVLLVGMKGAGKTTLTVRLTLSGYDFEGDENVFIRPGAVIARPRGMHVKARSLRFLPELGPLVPQLAALSDHTGDQIYNLDPRLFGRPWQIRQGKADVIILLRPNHGGFSSIRAIFTLTLARDIMAEIALPEEQRRAAIGTIVSLCSGAPGFDLSLGDHAGAVRCIDAACDAIHSLRSAGNPASKEN